METSIVNLSCPACGGKLEITPDIDRFACSYCGSEQIVQRGGGIVSLKPVLDSLQEVKLGVDKTAAELAIPRLEREIAGLTTRLKSLESDYLLSIQGAILGILVGFLISILFSVDICLPTLLFAGAGFFIGDRIRARKNKSRITAIKIEIEQKKKQLAQHKSIV